MKQGPCSVFLVASTLIYLIGQSAGQLVFDEEASRVCNGVDLLVASGNVTKGKQCVVFQTSCLDFECKFEVEAGLSSIVLVPIRMLAYIEPCALTGPSAEGDIGISIVHLYVHGYEDELVLEVHQTKNSSFVTELDTDTEEDVTMEINVTVVQRPQGVVFGVLLTILPIPGQTLNYISVYDPTLIRITCILPPPTAPTQPRTASPPPPTTSSPLSQDLIIGVAAGVPVFVLLLMIALVTTLVLVLFVLWRRNKLSNDSNLTYLNREERSEDNSRRYTDLKVSGNPLFHHQLPLPVEEEEEEETYDEINIMRPVYGITSMEWNFVQFNTIRSRKDEAWTYPRSNLTYLKDISQGQYTKIMLMEAKDIANVEGVMPVIVKALCSSEKVPQHNFDQELQLRKTFHHQNIASLLGVCTDKVGLTMMVLELMDYGNLLQFVRVNCPTKYREAVLDYSDFYNFASDISSALQYLAEKDVVHNGVAAENCLVGRNLMVKLTGFSSAAIGESAAMVEEESMYFTMVTDNGPPPATPLVKEAIEEAPPKKTVDSEGLMRWKAPEALVYGKSTTKSDVWSFGVLLWELTTHGSVPYTELSTNDVLQNALRGTLQLSLPANCPKEYSKVFASCQRPNPVDRPLFKELFELLSMKANNVIKSEGASLYEL